MGEGARRRTARCSRDDPVDVDAAAAVDAADVVDDRDSGSDWNDCGPPGRRALQRFGHAITSSASSFHCPPWTSATAAVDSDSGAGSCSISEQWPNN